MLRRISANRDTFQPIDFVDGFNVILAERGPEATDQHSRNARGKSTLLHVINYCLGANLASSLRPLVDDDWSFTLTLDLFGGRVSASRGLKGGNKLRIEFDDTSGRVIDSYLDEQGQISLDDWKFLLGLGLFGLDVESDDKSFRLSARTLISYVFRTDNSRDPLKVVPQQPAWSSREHISYLLDLDWKIVRDLAKLNKEAETYKALQYAASENLLPGMTGEESNLALRRAEQARTVAALERRVDRFQLIEDPNEILRRADTVTDTLRELRDNSLVDRRLLELYRSSIEDEVGTDSIQDVRRVYEEMGVAFSSPTLRRFEEVQEFHERLISNRRVFLEDEIQRISAAEDLRQEEIVQLTNERNRLMGVLQAGGALEELNALHAQLLDATRRLAEFDSALNRVRELAGAEEDMQIRRAQRRRDALRELATNRIRLDRVAESFDSMVNRLYGRSAVLATEVDNLGFKFTLKTAGVASTGVNKMQLLCFDLTLLSEGADWSHHPDFLVHDSNVFDGVDPRQVEAGLYLTQEIINGVSAQYIMTMNSNDVPENIQKEPWFITGTRKTVYDTDEGGILGVTF